MIELDPFNYTIRKRMLNVTYNEQPVFVLEENSSCRFQFSAIGRFIISKA